MESTKSIPLKSFEQIDFHLKIEPKGSSNKTRVEFSVIDPNTAKKKRFKKSTGLGGKLSDKQLIRNANELIDSIIELMETVWDPVTGAVLENRVLTKQTTSGYFIFRLIKQSRY